MRHFLTLIGLILALSSITPASVLVCGSVLTPEMILQWNDAHDFDIEVDCAPQSASINVSTITFSSFVQSGFVAAIFLMMLAKAKGYRFFENQSSPVTGCIVTPPTPPPTFLVS